MATSMAEPLKPFPTAARLAGFLHHGQVDKAGKPYIGHLQRVATNLMRMFPDYTLGDVDAAWLHDSLEDTFAHPAFLIGAGVSTEVVHIILALTRPPVMNYLYWIERMVTRASTSVVRVKLADLTDNMDASDARARRDAGGAGAEREPV
jgi:(p)ppGpp synthase/HD superfamily hydrolase